MSEIAEKPDRVYVGAQVDRDKRDQLVQFARESDQSVSQIIRKALAAQLERDGQGCPSSSDEAARRGAV